MAQRRLSLKAKNSKINGSQIPARNLLECRSNISPETQEHTAPTVPKRGEEHDAAPSYLDATRGRGNPMRGGRRSLLASKSLA
ncbi:conserved hypothetical protein [Ricinus communis]|uniref:Uncharacterized protein n=1 Tax=Ricinus communis TaxID=3988 RepID=B9SRW5_RICCO|nr:conserved hypothetical protein [Ricinus communis]